MSSDPTIVPARRSGKGDPEADEAVYAALHAAILEGRIAAGTKLAETPLAEAFGVSRERIRKVLHRLVAERRLEAVPNRGVRVPQPTLDDVRAIYQAHRVLEAGVLRELAEKLDDRLLGELRMHVGQEQRAAMERDRAASVRLSGAFHLRIADALGNAQLSAMLRDLLTRSSIMVSVYESIAESFCGVQEHGAIVEALARHDVERAIALSGDHFRLVEARLQLRPQPPKVDVARLFGPIGEAGGEEPVRS
ncbi:MAG: GntR family transcriptional regulator [Ancalomicrobiaceae bacterium]|nr:GntR family transcriptional regulator [Ancalomicrobiaceae bacterium]